MAEREVLPRLSDTDRRLIEAAETKLWGPILEHALRAACQNHGIMTGRFDNCGDLADALRLVDAHAL